EVGAASGFRRGPFDRGDNPTGTTDIPLTDNCRRLAERMRPVLARNALRLLSGYTSGSGRCPLSKACPWEQGKRSMRAQSRRVITRDQYDAVLFDLDGVITDTANLHAACWKQMFDEYLQKRATQRGEAFRPFDLAADYRLYVDGKSRFDGVRDFLTSRDIQ